MHAYRSVAQMRFCRVSARGGATATALLIYGLLATRLLADDGQWLQLEERAVKLAVQRVADAVVKIETLGGREAVDGVLIGSGPTTGLVVDATGYIISSAFNFIQKPASIMVTLHDGTQAPAEIVARDHSRQVVLLKVAMEQAPQNLPVAVPREEIKVGQRAIAVGRTYSEDFPNLSVGIVSAVNRIWDRAVQTDCKVSPANYGGPLLDIQGRVLGLLLPLSPQETSAIAGSEWYDAGVGFAVPLVDILQVLPRMKQGQDLHRGLLGVTLKSGSELVEPAVVATTAPRSPAAEAGMRPGDTIVACQGRPIALQTHLKHALGPLYAGDTVELTYLREGQTTTVTVALVDRIRPYELPFLGILPVRRTDATVVRQVVTDSPAHLAGLQAGDRLLAWEGQPLTGPAAWREAIAAKTPGDAVRLSWQRGEEQQTAQVTLAPQPDRLIVDPDASGAPEESPPAGQADDGEGAGWSLVQLALPESPNKCLAYVPETEGLTEPHGLVVWLTAPGVFDEAEFAAQWQPLCARFQLMVLAPQPADPERWQVPELRVVRRALDEMRRNYPIDATRIAVCGHQAGGALGFRFAFENREIIRGLGVLDATAPTGMQFQGNDPVERLFIYAAWPEQSPLASRIQTVLQDLRAARFAVCMGSPWTEPALPAADLARWVDTLDRL